MVRPLFFDYVYQHDLEYDEQGFSCMVSKGTFGIYMNKNDRVAWANMYEWRCIS